MEPHSPRFRCRAAARQDPRSGAPDLPVADLAVDRAGCRAGVRALCGMGGAPVGDRLARGRPVGRGRGLPPGQGARRAPAVSPAGAAVPGHPGRPPRLARARLRAVPDRGLDPGLRPAAGRTGLALPAARLQAHRPGAGLADRPGGAGLAACQVAAGRPAVRAPADPRRRACGPAMAAAGRERWRPPAGRAPSRQPGRARPWRQAAGRPGRGGRRVRQARLPRRGPARAAGGDPAPAGPCRSSRISPSTRRWPSWTA